LVTNTKKSPSLCDENEGPLVANIVATLLDLDPRALADLGVRLPEPRDSLGIQVVQPPAVRLVDLDVSAAQVDRVDLGLDQRCAVLDAVQALRVTQEALEGLEVLNEDLGMRLRRQLPGAVDLTQDLGHAGAHVHRQVTDSAEAAGVLYLEAAIFHDDFDVRGVVRASVVHLGAVPDGDEEVTAARAAGRDGVHRVRTLRHGLRSGLVLLDRGLSHGEAEVEGQHCQDRDALDEGRHGALQEMLSN
jgi:hypothetical protein